jgi:hypothetical protein
MIRLRRFGSRECELARTASTARGHKPRFREAQLESREGGNEDKALEHSETVLRPATRLGDAQNKF